MDNKNIEIVKTRSMRERERERERERVGYKKAFTLAEVLITLAIIGVVAALTIPTVVRNYQKQQTITGLKKMYSTLTNALNLAQAENGGLEGCFIDTSDNKAKTQYFYDKCLKNYLKVQKECAPTDATCWDFENLKGVNGTSKGYCSSRMRDRNADKVVLLADGTSMFLWTGGSSKVAGFCVDINGLKKPNKMGRDTFMVYLNANKANTIKYGTFMYGAYEKPPLTRQELLEGNYGCTKNSLHGYSGAYCGALIQRDGWEIKDDYPW